MKKTGNLLIFLFVVLTSLFLPILKCPWPIKLSISLLAFIITFYLYKRNLKLFVPTLFFAINGILNPFVFYLINRFELYIPQINFLLPVCIYLFIVFRNEHLRKEITWWKRGEFDKTIIILIIFIVILTGLSLIIWSLYFKQNLDHFLDFIPDIPFILLLLYGLAFPVFNGFFEEFLARAVLFDGFSELFRNYITVIFSQAIIFAIWHYRGFPGGIIGMSMVFIWSVALGYIRYRSKGMLAPLIAHFFADLSIAMILLFVFILPNRV